MKSPWTIYMRNGTVGYKKISRRNWRIFSKLIKLRDPLGFLIIWIVINWQKCSWYSLIKIILIYTKTVEHHLELQSAFKIFTHFNMYARNNYICNTKTTAKLHNAKLRQFFELVSRCSLAVATVLACNKYAFDNIPKCLIGMWANSCLKLYDIISLVS